VPSSAEQIQLLDLPPLEKQIRIRNLKKPFWTENKAKLIERYIYYFEQITRHGTYIDGFAGPQEEKNSEMWSAKLVLELRPRWLRHFYLIEKSAAQMKRLRELVNRQPPRDPKKEPKREVILKRGDVNVVLPSLLAARPIIEAEATFCLLDQRTFECHWSTVRAVAEYKHLGLKIEIFYFFPIGWLDRALSALRDEKKARAWWGGDEWRRLEGVGSISRGELIAERFRAELGYKHATPFPIFERKGGGRIMYFMIHASDHDEAPKLMWRAYHNAVRPIDLDVQLEFGSA
jgi:three-Cys-motif partner protein